MSALRTTYKVLRSLLFTAVISIAVLYVCLYILLSIPAVQNGIKTRAEKEVSKFLNSKVTIGTLEIYPFNEVRLSSLQVYTPTGQECLRVDKLGAGIYLWDLLWEKKITVTYLEVVGLDGKITKANPEAPYNIDFIIHAFQPKDKNKPPQKIDLRLHNIVLRKSALTYDLLWKNESVDAEKFNISHICLNDLKADISIPVLKNDDIIVDLRRLSFRESSGFKVDKLRAYARISPTSLEVKDIGLKLPGSEIKISPIRLEYPSFKDIMTALDSGERRIDIESSKLTPSDFKAFLPILRHYQDIYMLNIGVSGNLRNPDVETFDFSRKSGGLSIQVNAKAKNLQHISSSEVIVNKLDVKIASDLVTGIISDIPKISPHIKELILSQKDITLSVSGNYSGESKNAGLKVNLVTDAGSLSGDADLKWRTARDFQTRIHAFTDGFSLNQRLNNRFSLGFLAFSADGEIIRRGNVFDVDAAAFVDEIEINEKHFHNINFSGEKKGGYIAINAEASDQDLDFKILGNALLAGSDSEWSVEGEINKFYPGMFGFSKEYNGYDLGVKIKGDITGNDIDNLTGRVQLSDLNLVSPKNGKLRIDNIDFLSEKVSNIKRYAISSDILNGEARGNFSISNLIADLSCLANVALPSFTKPCKNVDSGSDWMSFSFTLDSSRYPSEFLHFPVRPYANIDFGGGYDGRTDKFTLSIDAPYLVQGEKKLIRNSNITVTGSKREGIDAKIYSTVPAKNDDAIIQLSLKALGDSIDSDIRWKFEKNKTATGQAAFSANLDRSPQNGNISVDLWVKPTAFRLNGAEWSIGESKLLYKDNVLSVDNLNISHDRQFVNINGKASGLSEDTLLVKLADIDLSYIFEALNINYVTFGGIATGEISASSLFSKLPIMKTENLFVKDLSYNGAVLGNGDIESHWINDDKAIAINADITNSDGSGAKVNGGIYLTRDSLSFDMDAQKVNISFLKPFMEAFTSDVGGRASGKAKLYGTFKDIDLVGKVFADSISMKVDYTNVYYHGSDSVSIEPGYINIPSFRLYDKYGNSAMLKGSVKHRYFHEPEFEFKVSEANNLLCYDTNARLNPDWYGTIYASGGGLLKGRPGIVSMMMDMTTAPNSEFTFVLNDTQTAADYTFLTFSDKKKEEMLALQGTVDLKEKFEKEVKLPEFSKPSVFAMDIRCSVLPTAKMNLVMDPKAGDKITARGEGPLQISYDTESDEMKIYGKYTLSEGNYNFSLQDLILRDFKINPGSNISFNGDPLQALLNITAAYRVNTNLSDLDKSFSTDRDLNRTNVPVDALLNVKGDMRSPEITFDISLPTLTQDVERKVKSIISTEDMMNRQIIYLLALNRFYTPEYMGTSSNGGGELASVASSTLSSQLSNMMGQLTDKFTVAPSFRSDKGDFSDMEVDVALSSRLLDNRLLINGNFGYRDRSTSQTTFIGDFDIEYLLNKNGNLRLKAYNHFNDQYYYLKSALTTQGIGVVYRRDFDNPFTFLRRKKSKKNIPLSSDDKDKNNAGKDSTEPEKDHIPGNFEDSGISKKK